jgi:prolyl-tRNA synthetase
MREAYFRIFKRCGLEFVAVEADTGSIGGSSSHEFMVLADSGEDDIAACAACSYGANVEKAEVKTSVTPADLSGVSALEKVSTPGQRTIEEVSAFLKVSPDRIAKTLVFTTDKGLVAVCVRGDRDANPAKVKNLMGANTAELADDAAVREATGAPTGFAGPVGIKCPVYLDNELKGLAGFVAGANEADTHLLNVVPGRDFTPAGWADLRTILPGDPCPRCGTPVSVRRGIEVGHIFKLGTKYSEKLEATYLDAHGKEIPVVMGCYGIGVGRSMAAAIEQNHDEHGIKWPVPIAPWEVAILPLQIKDEPTRTTASDLAASLEAAGVEVLVDDRDERPGVKFMDADLLGVPLRITLGARGLKEGVAEVKERATGLEHRIPLAEIAQWARRWVEERRGV